MSCAVEMELAGTLHNGDHARTILHGVNILDWINAPKKFSKGMNIGAHIRSVQRFIEQIGAQNHYALAILTNSLDEDCQLELFSHPDYDESEDDIDMTTNLLERIFMEQTTEISNLVILLGERQDSNESVTNFLSRLRVKAYKLMGVPSDKAQKEQKEQYILSAFINGLRDRRIAKAVEMIKPTNTESALFVAKKEENKQGRKEAASLNIIKEEDDSSTQKFMAEMSLQIKLLSEQVQYLTSLIKKREQTPQKTYAQAARGSMPQIRPTANPVSRVPERVKPFPSGNRRPPIENRDFMQCWNCNKNGHSWRNCWKRILCKRCSSTGHVSQFCRNEAIRYFEMEDDTDDKAAEENEKLSIITEETEMANNDCFTILETEEEKPKIPRRRTCQKKEKRRKFHDHDVRYHENINEWVDYVNGRKHQKPMHYNPTVISESRSETAANKPLVRGKCEGRSVPILVDSGAALNVVDESFVKEFCGHLKLRPESLTIRCANGGKVASLGKMTMKIKIGNVEERMKFSVIPNLFPKMIIGLRQMKHSNIVIDAKADSIWIRNEKVPFVSKTRSIASENH